MKNLALTLILSFTVLTVVAQGKVLQDQKMKSKILDKEVLYSVYLPPGFDDSKQAYPVIYLLHGYGNNHNTWITEGQIAVKMDKAIREGLMPPAVVVMPHGETTWYVNVQDKKYRWEDMFMEEFMPYAEKTYRTGGSKENRVIWGASMGGFGALKYAMTYRDKFGTCIAFSPAVYPDGAIGDRYQISESPLNIIKKVPVEKLNEVRYYVDCGDKDFLYWGNATLHIMFRNMGINHEFRMRGGKHGWVYWREGVEPALAFIAEGMKNRK